MYSFDLDPLTWRDKMLPIYTTMPLISYKKYEITDSIKIIYIKSSKTLCVLIK